MADKSPRTNRTRQRPSRQDSSRPPRLSETEDEAARQWRDAEQQAPATESAAQELLDRAGSAERAKDAIDKVDGQHPP